MAIDFQMPRHLAIPFRFTTNPAATTIVPDHRMVSLFSIYILQCFNMCFHDEISITIRSFHSSSDEPFSGTDEGYYFLGCLIKHLLFFLFFSLSQCWFIMD
ncbi:hypothetical protein M431DRAFT_259195 [Trichoderma harzianum CBS 226.95]|uniref:Uncharacterized protein n=1 Tax=Trichoderma harzianum CBS 226.95 TaxID=983964 RepID=A0A2T3ZYZ6_TRIHA|nr:hypothetical protein M431DRAFT_259195 [Trichoderma harzianum CBS 226.95]PTB50030.1 hypothetical protein M431DRAFT_259195 [Trichoderma harzianum CBS 226.95]